MVTMYYFLAANMASPEFTAWCERQGIRLNGIQAAYVAEGWRGVVATAPIEDGGVILEVPERVLMSARSAVRDPRLRAALVQHAGLSPLQVGVHLHVRCISLKRRQENRRPCMQVAGLHASWAHGFKMPHAAQYSPASS